MLSESDDVDVVGTASSGRQAVDLAASLRPDAVVMDLHMGDLDGIEATRRIVKAAPETAVLALTMHDDDASLRATVDAGARGYLLKEASGEDVVRALRSVTRGDAVFGAALAPRVLGQLGGAAPPPTLLPGLTIREIEVLDHVARGRTNREIAQRLYLSDKTVRNHVSNIFTKLGVADRAAAGEMARDAGLGRDAGTPRWRDAPAHEDGPA